MYVWESGTVWISCFFFYDLFFSVSPRCCRLFFDFFASRLVLFMGTTPPPPHCYTICYDSPKFMDPPTCIILVVAVVAIIVITIIITPSISIIMTHARSPHAQFPSRLASPRLECSCVCSAGRG